MATGIGERLVSRLSIPAANASNTNTIFFGLHLLRWRSWGYYQATTPFLMPLLQLEYLYLFHKKARKFLPGFYKDEMVDFIPQGWYGFHPP